VLLIVTVKSTKALAVAQQGLREKMNPVPLSFL